MSLSELHKHLTQFQDLQNLSNHPSDTSNGFEWAWHYDGGRYDYHVGASVMVHGNEVGPLSGLIAIIDALSHQIVNFGGRFTCFIGNVEAALEQKRFLDEDLNRVFTFHNDPQTHEQKRAQQLLPILDSLDLYIDFHQTILDVQKLINIC